MKTIVLTLVLSVSTFATCFMSGTVCSPDNNFQNIYEIRKVTCSAPGGPANTSTHLNILNKAQPTKLLIAKKFNFTRDRYFQAKFIKTGKTNYLEIDDRSLESEDNINISTKAGEPLELLNYTCKKLFL